MRHPITLLQRQLSIGSAALCLALFIPAQASAFANATALPPRHTVYAIDVLGFGASAKHDDSTSISDQVAASMALLNAEKVTKADLLANSVRGWVASTSAATYPSRTNRLVLMDAAGFKATFEGESPIEFCHQTVAET
ncbi:alpha/beta fold hydrolase [Nostoc sp. NIES-2111]